MAFRVTIEMNFPDIPGRQGVEALAGLLGELVEDIPEAIPDRVTTLRMLNSGGTGKSWVKLEVIPVEDFLAK